MMLVFPDVSAGIWKLICMRIYIEDRRGTRLTADFKNFSPTAVVCWVMFSSQPVMGEEAGGLYRGFCISFLCGGKLGRRGDVCQSLFSLMP